MPDVSSFLDLEALVEDCSGGEEDDTDTDEEEDADANGNLVGFVIEDSISRSSSQSRSSSSEEEEARETEGEGAEDTEWEASEEEEEIPHYDLLKEAANDADSRGNLIGFVVSDSDSDTSVTTDYTPKTKYNPMANTSSKKSNGGKKEKNKGTSNASRTSRQSSQRELSPSHKSSNNKTKQTPSRRHISETPGVAELRSKAKTIFEEDPHDGNASQDDNEESDDESSEDQTTSKETSKTKISATQDSDIIGSIRLSDLSSDDAAQVLELLEKLRAQSQKRSENPPGSSPPRSKAVPQKGKEKEKEPSRTKTPSSEPQTKRTVTAKKKLPEATSGHPDVVARKSAHGQSEKEDGGEGPSVSAADRETRQQNEQHGNNNLNVVNPKALQEIRERCQEVSQFPIVLRAFSVVLCSKEVSNNVVSLK